MHLRVDEKIDIQTEQRAVNKFFVVLKKSITYIPAQLMRDLKGRSPKVTCHKKKHKLYSKDISKLAEVGRKNVGSRSQTSLTETNSLNGANIQKTIVIKWAKRMKQCIKL